MRREFTARPHSSTRRNATGLSQPTVQRILRQDLRWHPYRIQLLQELGANDHTARLAFAESQLNALQENPGLLGNLVFSDEAHFYLNGEVNRQDFRLWSEENPHWFTEEPLHPEKVTVWLGVGLNGFIGPVFWQFDPRRPRERGINARWYEAMLKNQAIPALHNR